MPISVPQSGTTVIVMGPASDKTDGVTPKTALTPVVYLRKPGGSFAARNSATAITHDRDGYYLVELNATDKNTVGPMRAEFSDATLHIPVWEYIDVMTDAAYTTKYNGITPTGGVAQAGTSSTITLAAGASAVDSAYNGMEILIQAGVGKDQSRRITGYVGATKVATVSSSWAVNPDGTSDYVILAG
jgi:hypothetical protein